jgi:RNA polymerase sigma-70 factor (ECF subfamily)
VIDPGRSIAGRAEQELVDGARAGRHEDFTALVRHYDARLRGLAYRLLGADRARMDDALQEAYLRAYRSIGAFRSDAGFGSWLYRITYNACIDELRKARRQPTPVDGADPVWDRSAATTGIEGRVAAADATARALATLPDEQRIAVVLVDAEGLDHATAAQILGVPPGTVASRLSRGRAALRRAIGAQS